METKKMPTEESKFSISYSREKFESDFMKIARLHLPQLSIARTDRSTEDGNGGELRVITWMQMKWNRRM
jgi:hypothetical protein